jgi:hypothetical protein
MFTLPSSNADSNSLFMSLPSGGWPHHGGFSHVATVNNTIAFVHALSRKGDKRESGESLVSGRATEKVGGRSVAGL